MKIYLPAVDRGALEFSTQERYTGYVAIFKTESKILDMKGMKNSGEDAGIKDERHS